MVLDQRYGFYFHTAMHSKNKVFVHTECERNEVYTKECNKVLYLIEKLKSLLASGQRTFVYKRNEHISDCQLHDLGAVIADKGPGQLLYVSDQVDGEVGNIRKLDENIFVGKIDKFASYSEANTPSKDGWHLVLKRYLAL